MTSKGTIGRTAREEAKATRKLAQLKEDTEEARAELARLHQDVAEAEDQLSSTQAAQLREANEQLVVSTLRAQTHAETCQEELKEVARSTELDALTELPNRARLLERFAQAIASARRSRTRVGVLFVDLDNFKEINDTQGHAVGDEALKLAAQCLRSAVRDVDTVSRHGGDEFVMLVAQVARSSDAVLVAEKVIAALGAGHRLGAQAVILKASIGISIYPDDGEDADTLIGRADAAMYLAKKQGLGRVVLHGQEGAPPADGAS
jgi:diguanylate cyclase (GGDEF)-like protein